MRNTKEIVQCLKEMYGHIENANVIGSFEFDEERTENMIVVGITNSEQVNVGLPDYKYDVEVTVDCFIEEDKKGEEFNRISDEVREVLRPFVERNTRDFSSLFNEIPIVGILYNGEDISITAESNRLTIRYSLFASYPI